MSNLTKATITNLDDKDSEPIECMFNPSEYSVQKRNTWSKTQTSGTNLPEVEFSGGEPATLSMDLLFDTFQSREDVRKVYTDRIWALMLVNDEVKDSSNNKSRPAHVHFQWGKSWSFDAVITSIDQSFTLFLEDGTPVRATLKISFQQLKDESLLPPQNPTSGVREGHRVWTVRPGDTLAGIAHRTLGSPNRWRRIARINRLQHVRTLPAGKILVIPND